MNKKPLRAFVSSCEKKKEEATPALVPKLRFPGFDKPWSYDPLSKTLREHKIKNTAGRDVFSVSMEYGIVNQIALLGRSYAAADTSHYTIGRRFDVVYTKSPLKAFSFGIVKQCKFDGEVALSPLYGVFTPPNPHLGLMIEAYFESPNRSKDFLSPLCQKGAKNTLQITNTTFLSGRMPLPTEPPEQQKIAECLSSVDELMAAQARKVDALKTHKKGLMQQLFPREGETQPRLRFPEFQAEWNDGPLEALCVSVSSGKDQREADGAFDLYGSTGIIGKTASPSYDAPHILVARVGANAGLLTRATGQFGVTDNTLVISLKSSVNIDFVFYYLGNININKLIFGSGQPLITGTILKNLRVLVPHVAEQQRIASCLSSLDALITAETQKHEALKTHKKGLMQQLFPSPDTQPIST
jgi:type I restriction enzyme, S subunit